MKQVAFTEMRCHLLDRVHHAQIATRIFYSRLNSRLAL